MNAIVYGGLAAALRCAGALSILEQRYQPGAVFIMMLHRVLPADEMGSCYNPHLALTPDALDAFLQFANQTGTIVSLDEALQAIAASSRSRKPIFAITFDDGWEDNHRWAFPILQKHRAAATIFLATDLIGTRQTLPEARLWNIWQAAEPAQVTAALLEQKVRVADYPSCHQLFKTLPMARKSDVLAGLERRFGSSPSPRASFLDWTQVREMAAAQIQFGSHTCSHAVLQAEDAETVRRELSGSRNIIREHTGQSGDFFAYPNGMFNPDNARAVQAAGFRAAVTTFARAARNGDEPYGLPRVSLDNAVVNGIHGRFSTDCCRLHLLHSARPRAAAAGSY